MDKTPATILMIGTSLQTQGGIASVVRVLESAQFFNDDAVRYIETHCDGGRIAKTGAALMGWLRFVRTLLVERVCLVHVHLASRSSFWRKWLFVSVARLFSIPYVLHLHGSEFHLFFTSESSRAARALIVDCFESAARVIVLSERWRDWVQGQMPHARVETIYNPVVLPRIEVGIRPQGGFVLFLGRIGSRKGAFDLISAIALIAGRFPQCRAVLAGDGELEQARARAKDLGISDRIEILGWVQAEEKARLLEQADVYVLPSFNEGLPMSILEALAAGVPVVSTPVGGIAEAVTDGQEGYLVEPGNVAALAGRIAQLLDDDHLRWRMGQAARRKAEDVFSTSVVLPRLRRLYDDLGCPRR